MNETRTASKADHATRQKAFALGDILSITTHKLVSDRHMDGVYDILNFMTGESLFTHQLPRASEICGPELLKQHPALAEIDAEGVYDKATAESFVTEQIKRYGETLPVVPLSQGIYEPRHPIQEAIDMGAKHIITTDGSPESVDALITEITKSNET